MIDEIPDVARSVAELRKFMDGFVRALEALTEGVSEAAPDEVRAFLPTYARSVLVFDERLVHCAELLGRGLRDEALGYESDAPALLEAVTLLDLASKPHWETWKSALASHGFPMPTMPRMDLAAALFDARNVVVDLKPHLDRWRRLNLSNAPLSKRLRMLRKLRSKDPNNEVWFESLIEHERQRLMELERDIKFAITTKDEQSLTAILAELEDDWVEPVPGRLKASATSALDGFKSSRLDRQMDEVGHTLVAAYEARDLDSGRQLRRQWAALLEEKGAPAAADPRVRDAEPAAAWVDRHDRLEALFAEIWQSLDAEPSGVRARRSWVRSLERMGQEIEDLAEKLHEEVEVEPIERALERVSRVLDAFDREERFRRRLTFAGVAAVTTLLAGLVIARHIWIEREQRIRDAVAEIDKLEAGIRSGNVTSLPEVDQEWPSWVRADPRVSGKWAMAEAEFAGQDERRGRFAAACEAIATNLRGVQSALGARTDPLAPWPVEFAAATRGLAGIETAGDAVTDGERAQVVRLAGEIDIAKTKLQGVADAFVETEIGRINARLVELRERLNNDRSAVIRGVEEQRGRFLGLRQRASTQAAAEAAGAYGGLRMTSAKVRPLLAEDGVVAKQVDDLSALVAKWEGFEKAVGSLDEKLGDWPQYAAQLRAIATGFPDIPEARDYADGAADEPIWAAADEWSSFTESLPPLAAMTAVQADACLKRVDALGPAAAGLEPVRDFKERLLPSIRMQATRKPADVKRTIQEFLDGVWLAEIRSIVTVQEEQQERYCLDVPDVGAFCKYVSGWKTKTGWPLKVTAAPVAAVKPAPQLELRDAVAKMLKAWPAQPQGTQFDEDVVEVLEAVIEKTNVDPVVRLVTFRQWFLAARDHSLALQCEQAAGLQAMLKNDRRDDQPIPGLPKEDMYLWVKPDRDTLPGYVVAKGKANDILDQAAAAIPAIRQAIAAGQALLANASGERLVLVGRAGLDAEGKGTAVLREKVGADDLWWLDRTGRVRRAGTIGAGDRFAAANPAAPAGSPLYRRERFGAQAKPQADAQEK